MSTSALPPKAARGRTTIDRTPISVRAPDADTVTARLVTRVRAQLTRRLGHAGVLIERATVRFADVNGPRGGIDTVCRIELVVSGRPAVRATGRGAGPEEAFAAALPVLVRTFERTRDRHGLSAGRGRRSGRAANAAVGDLSDGDAGELIGRRVGRGAAALTDALERPEKRRGDLLVDTAAPGRSASDRRAGGASTARRNSRARTSRATATLEDSRTRPSRKSTRRSANRGKPSQTKERAAVASTVTPRARAMRAAAARRR